MKPKINSVRKPLPSTGAKIVRNEGLVVKKGGSAMPSPALPEINAEAPKSKK